MSHKILPNQIMNYQWLPNVAMGTLCFMTAFAYIRMPETHNRPLAQTIEEAEELMKTKSDSWKRNKIIRNKKVVFFRPISMDRTWCCLRLLWKRNKWSVLNWEQKKLLRDESIWWVICIMQSGLWDTIVKWSKYRELTPKRKRIEEEIPLSTLETQSKWIIEW